MDQLSESTLQSIKENLKTEAHRLGFSHIGFTNPGTPTHFDTFIDWINKGHAGSMSYMSRPDTVAKRKDPMLILRSCKSIIVLALPYSPSGEEKKNGHLPKIANYAIGDDYHLVIPRLLDKLVDSIKTEAHPYQIEYRIYTDTGPILEKEFAQRAGLGWIGKNGCLIIPGAGSNFFLAEILINLPFEPNIAFEKDLCGKCTRCLESCPTECILSNRTIDANRCISFLTIENRGDIAEELRTKMNGWIFGCDVCQQVCPWNIKFSREPEPNYFQPGENIKNFDLLTEIRLGPSDFKKKYSNSPILRTKYFGFKRNLLIAAGNHFQTTLTAAIEEIMNNEENPALRELAGWVLNVSSNSQGKQV
ncbi:MAG: tRNA epoxyqueuosine(34) reductase QueG [Anaerolineaceae bacterium]|jgi:epoxyqueuosine reductase|nr:tRNA epoxyqueuosine(34) reductase QueG [Anaerolineaceae bacterium]